MMRRRRRSSLQWAVRLCLAVLAVGLGFISVVRALAPVLPVDAIARAHTLAPENARIAARLSQTLVMAQGNLVDNPQAKRIAVTALRRDPTAVEAVFTLGVIALLHNDEARGRQLIAYSQMLSRRDLQTQLWLIEDKVTRGDVAGALHHYDIALRTKRDAPDLLYPVLTSAIADPAIRQALAKTLAKQPAWTKGFLDYLAGNNSDAVSTVLLYEKLRRVNVVVSQAAQAAVIGKLINGGKEMTAWKYYGYIRSGVNRRVSRDPEFNDHHDVPTMFDWSVIDEPGTSGSIQSGLFDFAVTSSATANVVLQQTQLLPAGTYILQGHSIGIDQPRESSPYWLLHCRDGRDLGQVDVLNSSIGQGHFNGTIVVPSDCPVQMLQLVVRPSSVLTGVAGQIDKVSLHPVSSSAG